MFDNNTTGLSEAPAYQNILDHINVVCYLLIFTLGIVGNGLVIYVVLIYAKMKTVTNMYILSLALSDILFLAMLPFTAATVLLKHWIFGLAMCKIYFVLCAVNVCGGAFNLCAMSADRYLAVCHPIQSIKYRTPRVALCLCLCVWALTFIVMLPTIPYTKTIDHPTMDGKYSCRLEWPDDNVLFSGSDFVLYSFTLGFIIPVSFITIFYVLIVFRLRRLGKTNKSKEKRRPHGRVTLLIFTVVTVYVCCWLPYWSFQVHGIFNPLKGTAIYRVMLINFFTILSYANSMLNPLLYAFISDNFRQSFMKAFCLVSSNTKGQSSRHEKSVLLTNSHNQSRVGNITNMVEKIELSTINKVSSESEVPTESSMCSKIFQDDRGFLKPPS